jgi:hypothetical protein
MGLFLTLLTEMSGSSQVVIYYCMPSPPPCTNPLILYPFSLFPLLS